MKFSDVDVTVKTKANDGLLIAIIKERGIGIHKEIHQHIYTKYYMAKNAANFKGIELGLTVLKNSVASLGGTF